MEFNTKWPGQPCTNRGQIVGRLAQQPHTVPASLVSQDIQHKRISWCLVEVTACSQFGTSGTLPTLLTAHQAPLSEVVFHPSQPDHLFTCSQGGDVCHWNGASIRRSGALESMGDNLNTSSPWLSSEAVKHKVETHSLVARQPLPVNSIDVVGHSVVFGGDNEAFFVLNNVIF